MAPKGANRLLVYAGIAVLEYVGRGCNTTGHSEAEIVLGGPDIVHPHWGDNFGGKPFFLAIEAIATVGLASIGTEYLDNAEYLIWAVDDAWIIDEVVVDRSTKFLKIHAKLAIGGFGVGIGRLNYRAYVLAIA